MTQNTLKHPTLVLPPLVVHKIPLPIVSTPIRLLPMPLIIYVSAPASTSKVTENWDDDFVDKDEDEVAVPKSIVDPSKFCVHARNRVDPTVSI